MKGPDPVFFLPLVRGSGSGMDKNPYPGWIKIQIRDEHRRTYIWVLSFCFGLKILKFFDADADPGWKTRIRDPGFGIKNPRSATLQVISRGSSRWQAGFIYEKLLNETYKRTYIFRSFVQRSFILRCFFAKKTNTKKRVQLSLNLVFNNLLFLLAQR